MFTCQMVRTLCESVLEQSQEAPSIIQSVNYIYIFKIGPSSHALYALMSVPASVRDRSPIRS